MKRQVKQAVAETLIRTAADMVEHWEEIFENEGSEAPCTAQEARDIIVPWLLKLPGESWDIRLGEGE
ncbi:hypothetical protein ACFC1L_39895 [Streptomyces sp. NPDC056210]|uniref:hypothetical protein n=1 Tax=Streptomyces sp. NPDC056210 TaxID=3345746 RepID=UPI0035D81F10